MGNLGDYQMITTLAKKVGGPKKLLCLSGVTFLVAYEGCKFIVKRILENRYKNTSISNEFVIFSVTVAGIANNGLEFKIGDKFKVLESDGEAVLIEKIDDSNNPYFVSSKFLLEISEEYARYNKLK